MPTALDVTFRALAQSMLAQFGAPMELRSYNEHTTYDTETATVSQPTVAYSFKGFVNSGRRFFTPGSLVNVASDEILMDAVTVPVAPKNGDGVYADGRERKVLAFQAVYSGEQVALYVLATQS